MALHLPSPPWTMLASTAWVWSWGSRLREASWRKVAATIFWLPARAMRPVSGSLNRVSAAFFSIQARVRFTARPWASTMRASPPARAARETDLGAEKVRSLPGRWRRLPSLSRRPSFRPEPSGTSPSRTVRKTSGSTGPEEVQGFRSPAGPGALQPVFGVVFRVVAVPFVIGDALGGRSNRSDRDDHHCQSSERFSAASPAMPPSASCPPGRFCCPEGAGPASAASGPASGSFFCGVLLQSPFAGRYMRQFQLRRTAHAVAGTICNFAAAGLHIVRGNLGTGVPSLRRSIFWFRLPSGNLTPGQEPLGRLRAAHVIERDAGGRQGASQRPTVDSIVLIRLHGRPCTSVFTSFGLRRSGGFAMRFPRKAARGTRLPAIFVRWRAGPVIEASTASARRARPCRFSRTSSGLSCRRRG